MFSSVFSFHKICLKINPENIQKNLIVAIFFIIYLNACASGKIFTMKTVFLKENYEIH